MDNYQLTAEAAHFVDTERNKIKAVQKRKYDFMYDRITVTVPKGGSTVSTEITINSDADFNLEQWTGSYHILDGDETIPKLKVKFTDSGSNNTLTQNFVPFHLTFTPGFLVPNTSNSIHTIVPFKYMLKKNKELRIEFQNGSAVSDVEVSMVFFGQKYK